MTEADRAWLHQVADALDKAARHREMDPEGRHTLMPFFSASAVRNSATVVTISISDELARGVADRLRAIAEADDPRRRLGVTI